eukprot:gnl/TRDRNA2_/TRDRNA2_164113_c0_seq1.p3 gnl/TRDRNA2_/TRDRNA2_164113_c0~~gnl/TRDRNA2_/TRDRNA2_164113_c0_seq1.p3  ORF type:complete len:130 (+),score=20.43 gnl/TRDRNA2_/TRDRNA2_164113_c0_seq1:570-959(+)
MQVTGACSTMVVALEFFHWRVSSTVREVNEVGRLADDDQGGAGGPHFEPVSALDGKTFDLVIANILAPILVEIAAELEAKLAPGGCLALSGLRTSQAPKIVSVYEKLLDNVTVEQEEQGWVLVTATKRM